MRQPFHFLRPPASPIAASTSGWSKPSADLTPALRTPNKPMNIKPKRLKNLLKDLVDIYSPSGKEEEIVEFAEKYLEKHGLVISKQEVDENRFNLIAFPEGNDEVGLCFVGHLD